MALFNFVVYLFAVLMSLACTALLFRSYLASGTRLLFWSGLCFVGLSVSNLLLFIDLPVFTSIDLRPYRSAATVLGLLCLLYGFLMESE